MEYKPKVITGKVRGTGWPIDGHVLWFSQWDYDNRESWHLYRWPIRREPVRPNRAARRAVKRKGGRNGR